MLSLALIGIMIPFIGTCLGSACVLFMKNDIKESVKCALSGFAGGIMTSASIWSLLIPAIEQSDYMGKLSFIPAVTGFLLGIALFLGFDRIITNIELKNNSTMLMTAVTLHNIPEGMAVGVVYAGLIAGNKDITLTDALILSIGIAVQNFPEGAIISMPLKSQGLNKGKSFLSGAFSGIVEPIGAILTFLICITPLLPYLLGFAAGAMIYVVVRELIPEITESNYINLGTIFYALGFSVMMTLDVALG